MLETLLKILAVDVAAPEIILEDDGDIALDYFNGEVEISITPSGHVAWAFIGGKHGTELEEVLKLLTNYNAGVTQ